MIHAPAWVQGFFMALTFFGIAIFAIWYFWRKEEGLEGKLWWIIPVIAFIVLACWVSGLGNGTSLFH